MTQQSSIKVKNVTLTWPIHKKALRSSNNKNSSNDGGRFSSENDKIQFNALNNISFELKDGDRLGLIGSNGAGKSTLLRVLAGVYAPTMGSVHIKGAVSTLFTNSSGMHLEATGYENILLMSRFLGIKVTPELIKDIEEFTELGEFLNLPIHTYSSGMRTRLGFAIATSINVQSLLIDEVIGAGDKNFQAKAANRIGAKIDSAASLVLASHSSSVLKNFCNLGLWIEKGNIKQFGPIDDVLSEYEKNK